MEVVSDMNYNYSIRGRVNEATCTRDGDIQFFLNIINQKHNKIMRIWQEEEYYFNSLIAYLSAIELHELGHRYNWKDGCNHGKQLAFEKCAWCEETERIYWWLL